MDKKKIHKCNTVESNLWFTSLTNLHKLYISEKLLLFINELNYNESIQCILMYIFFLWSLILTYLNLYNDALIEMPDWSMLSTYLPKHIHKLGPCPWICSLHLSKIELYITYEDVFIQANLWCCWGREYILFCLIWQFL